MKNESLRMPKAVYGGEDALDVIPQVASCNKKAVLLTDKSIRSAGLIERPVALLRQTGAEVAVIDDLATEPSVEQAEAVISRFRAEKADLVVAVGGGSVMDVAKLCSILDTEAYSIRDLLINPAMARKTTPSLMIPTTAGTGSEATPNAIVLVPEKELKVGIVNFDMIADTVILDASLQRRLPAHIAAATGVDALAHAVECYTSNKATGFSDLYALGAMKLIFHNIVRIYDTPGNLSARQNMLLGSFYAGVAIAASGTTAVHALAYPLGGKYHIPHGVSNAMLLAPVMRFNMPCCAQRLATIYDTVLPQQSYPVEEKAERMIFWLEETLKHLNIPTSLAGFGVQKSDLDELVRLGMEVRRLLDNNCRELTASDARGIYAGLF